MDIEQKPSFSDESVIETTSFLMETDSTVSLSLPSETSTLLSLQGFSFIGDPEGDHWHYNPIEEFYNKCHGKGGKFCGTGGSGGGSSDSSNKGTGSKGSGSKGSGVIGKTTLKDGDGNTIDSANAPRGKKGGSLSDPHEGTRTIDGIRGYDKAGKPVPGSDAWLEAHGLTRSNFNSRPYVKYEASKNDPALIEAYSQYPKAERFFRQRAEQDGQHGGYLMYKHAVPGSPWGPIAPQARPNKAIVTNAAKEALAKKTLENDQIRLATLKKSTPMELRTERRAQLKRAELNLARTKSATPEKIRAEANKNLEKAQAAVVKAKAGGDPVALILAKSELIGAKRQHGKDMLAASKWDPQRELYFAETSLRFAQNRLQRSIEDPKGALAQEITSQERSVVRSENRAEKTAAKYVFPPGTSSARIDMNPDRQNVRNLVEGKGRIYFAMEGSIKNDAILNSIKKEDPTATVVNVPSVTLWQQKAGLPGEASGEVAWFAKKYGKGREVVLIPDADGVTNPNVMMQAKALSTALKYNGAKEVIIAAPPVKAGSKKVIEHFNLPSGVDEGRKGVDDHLGAGRGTLSQLQYTKTAKYPTYNLSEFTKAHGGDGPKANKSAIPNAEAALAAISGIAGPEGITKLPKKMLAQTAGLPDSSAKDARDLLVRLGLISVEHIYDEKALARYRRIPNPNISEQRVEQLVKQGVIKQPRWDEPYVEVSIEESPVVTILDHRFRVNPSDVTTGTLGDLSTWKPPKSFKGWTSSVNGAPDKTGIAAKLVAEASKASAKRAVTIQKSAAAAKVGSTKTAAKKVSIPKVAPPGRRLVRTKAGAAKYGVPIGSVVPILSSIDDVNTIELPIDVDIIDVSIDNASSEILTSFILIPNTVLTEDDLIEFYNQCHGADGRFCGGSSGGKGSGGKGSGVSGHSPGGSGGKGGSGSSRGQDSRGWPSSKGRTITTVAKAGIGSVKVDGIKAKAVYEITDSNGKTVRLYDKTGDAGKFKDALLNNHARMNEMYPSSPPHNIVVSRPGRGSELNRNDFSIVKSNKNPTYVNSNFLGFDVKAFRPGFIMPSAHDGNTKNMDYLMTHEYGHHVDFSRHVTGDTHTSSPLFSNPAFKASLSKYGKSSPVEAYAEAFAEWHYSRGRTKNPAAVAMARSEGWFGTGVTASGEVLNVMLPLDNEFVSLVNYGLVHFNNDENAFVDELLSFESVLFFQNEGEVSQQDSNDEILVDDVPADGNKGVSITDNFENGAKFVGNQKNPSKDEIAKATELIKQVYTDLGLDYEKDAGNNG